MKKIIISLFVTIMFSGCVVVRQCEEDNTFSMEFRNESPYAYDLYINGEYQQRMKPNTRETYDIPAGYFYADLYQKTKFEGEIFIDENFTGTYDACESDFVTFP